MSILQKINNFIFILLLMIWPWQTRYFLVQGVSEYTTRSLYLTDLIALLLVIFYVFGAKLNLKAKQYLDYFFFSLIPVAILAITQFLWQTTWPTKWLGLAKHDPAELGQVVIETANGGRWLRAYGSFDHPNILGGVMAVALLLLLISKKDKWSWLENTLTVLFSAALFMSFSRTAWLGLVVSAAVYYVAPAISSLNEKSLKGESKISKRFLTSVRNDRKYLSLVFIIFALLSLIYSPLVFTRLSASGRIEQKSINERVSYYTEAKELFLTHPYLGVGFRNYVPALMRLKPDQPAWRYQPVHNAFILFLVEMGVIRVIAIIIGLWLLARSVAGSKISKMNHEVLALCSLIFILGLFDHWLWSLHTGWLLIGLLAVISVRLMKENYK